MNMKTIFKSIILSLGLLFGLVACDLDVNNYQDIPTEEAYNSVQDVQNGMNGAYWALGTYRFFGKNIIAVGDMAADIAQGSSASGHYYNFGRYIINTTDTELNEMWEYGFRTIDRCVRTIQGAKGVLARSSELFLTDYDIADINLYMSQCYSLKALSTFALANVFCLPYQKGRNNLGLPLLTDKPLEAFTKIERSTLGETYDLILSDIASAKRLMEEALDDGAYEPTAFYMNEAAIYALESRVNLFMDNLDAAKDAAEIAIALKGTAFDKPGDETYVSMWSSLAITEEDIFTICKTEDDNLSANALNTLYGSYRGTLVPTIRSLFGENDIRLGLITSAHRPLKFNGLPTSQATNNIPIFRKSEMYLTIAEVEARLGNIAEAQEALLYTAKRDLDIATVSDLPNTQDELIEFIAEENIREFFQEGHRFYNARRTGEIITVAAGTKPNFDVSSFVYPIPANEINAGFCTQQNDGWADNLPR